VIYLNNQKRKNKLEVSRGRWFW